MSATEESLLREILARLAAIEAQFAAGSEARLTDREQDIIEALGHDKLTGEEVAAATGYEYDGHLKGTLASLVKRGVLTNDHPGYRRRRSRPSQD
jgi:hypothetical protein